MVRRKSRGKKRARIRKRNEIGVKNVTEKDNTINYSDYFYYDETSPSCLRWKVNRYAGYHGLSLMARAGDPAGTKTYRECGKPKCYRIHVAGKGTASVQKVIFKLFNIDVPKGYTIDHIDGNPFNNHMSNLKLKAFKGNSQNLAKAKNNSSGFTGVRWETTRNKLKTYAVANYWVTVNGVSKSNCEYFKGHEHGLLPAWKMACEWRIQNLKELNERGEEYTMRSYNESN